MIATDNSPMSISDKRNLLGGLFWAFIATEKSWQDPQTGPQPHWENSRFS